MEEFEKKFICDRDTFLKMKNDQKMIRNEVRYRNAFTEHYAKVQEWIAQHPGFIRSNPEYQDIRKRPWLATLGEDSDLRRAMNVVYGIIKGKPYSKIESKHHTEVDPYRFNEVCVHYNLDTSQIKGLIHD